MRPVPALSLLVALALVAGCIAPPDPEATGAVEGPLDPLLTQHDHWNVTEHALSRNASVVAWLPLVSPGKQSGAHSVDVLGDLLVVGTAEGSEANGFVLVDVSDPERPAEVGRWTTTAGLSGDRAVMLSADGKTVFVGGVDAIFAVDISDPASPKDAGAFANPRFGAHTLFAAEIDGTQYVYVVGYGLVTLAYDAAADAFEFLSRYVAATPDGLLDTPLGGDGVTYAFRDTYGHDVYAEKDPESGAHLAYVAYAYEGLKIVDLSNPRVPVEVGTWRPEDEHAPYYVHTIWMSHKDGRDVAVVGSEVFENRHVTVPSPVWVLDVVDVGAPKLLATWLNPGHKGSDNLLFSAHDLRVTPEGIVPLAHYHGGVWFLDLRDAAAVEASGAIRELGYAMPDRDNGWRPDGPCCGGFNMGGIPLTFDVLMQGRYAFAADLHTGLYVIRYDGPT